MMHGPMNVKYEFSSLVPHVTPWEGMSRHVPACPQSARQPCSYSFWHTQLQANSDICVTRCVCNVWECKTHLKFCTELHKIEIKTYELFKTKNEKAMSCTQVFEYFCCFKGGSTSIGSDEHSGYHSLRTKVTLIAELCDLVTADQRLIIRK